MLRLSEVYPLKVFPSVYHFKYIKEAYLTYPYHCCAFKFPATHDPEEFSKYLAFKENMEKMYCKQISSTTPVPNIEELVHDSEFRRRMKRGFRIIPTSAILNNEESDSTIKLRIHIKNPHRGRRKKHTRHNRKVKTLQRGTRTIMQLDNAITEDTVNAIHPKQGFFDFDYDEDKKDSLRSPSEWGSIPKSGKPYLFPELQFNVSDSEDFFGSHLETRERKPNLVHKSLPENPFEGVFHGTTVAVISEFELEAFCGQLSKNYRDVECFPSPDAFNPCEDVMGNMILRFVVWAVVITSVMGNVAVMVVLMSTGVCNSVSKFLMCNLAFADFCMGCYLLMIAAMDLHSMGTYFNYAIDWQHGK